MLLVLVLGCEMYRVKINCNGTHNKEKKLKLLEIFCSKDITVTKIFDTSDVFALFVINEEHVNKVFINDLKEALV